MALERSATLDRMLGEADANLVGKALVLEDFDARLVQIDPSKNIDRYYVLQGLEDPTADNAGKRFFIFQRWGRTGTKGQCKLEGPTTMAKVRETVAKVFKDKTGSEWGSVEPGDTAKPGKHWLQQRMEPDMESTWEYFVDDNVEGKKPGWYAYTKEASEEVEEIYAQHEANLREVRTALRVVESGKFSYKVDLEEMSQTNTRTNKVRQIRRTVSAKSKAARAKAAARANSATPMKAVVKKEQASAKAKPATPKKVIRKIEKVPSSAMKMALGKKLAPVPVVTVAATKAPLAMKLSKAAAAKAKAKAKGKAKAKAKAKGRPGGVSRRAAKSGADMDIRRVVTGRRRYIKKDETLLLPPSRRGAGKAAAGTPEELDLDELKGKKTRQANWREKAEVKRLNRQSFRSTKGIARGMDARRHVFNGGSERTEFGLTKEDIGQNKYGRLVSKKRQSRGKDNVWSMSVREAREVMGIKGFCPIGGKSPLGKALIEKARQIYNENPLTTKKKPVTTPVPSQS